MMKGEDSKPILVIVATLNEEKGVSSTLSEVNDCLGDPLCIVVDGRSTDRTVEVAVASGANVIFQKGFGKGEAIATAIDHAKGLKVKYVAFIDGDFTYPAEYLPKMIEILEQNPELGMVCGNRFNDQLQRGVMANTFYLGNKLLSFTHNLLNGVNLKDPLTGLRVVRWEIVKNWWPKSKGFDVEVELNHLVENQGFGITEIPIHYRFRIGEKKLKPRHGFTIFKRILMESLLFRVL